MIKIENKRKRIDSDAGYLVLRPEEFARLKTRLNESDGFDFPAAYAKLKDRLVAKKRHIADTLARINHTAGDDMALIGNMPEFCEQVGKAVGSMFGRENIVLVDHGSFKVCVVFNGGYALKVGLIEGGLETEIANSLKFPDLTCFPKLIDRDEAKNTCVVEAVNPVFEDSDCERFYGIGRADVVSMLGGEVPNEDSQRKFLEKLESAEGPEWDSVRDLREFFRKERILYDISFGNWGIAARNGHDVPVILDYDI